jgi:hypothetical protein
MPPKPQDDLAPVRSGLRRDYARGAERAAEVRDHGRLRRRRVLWSAQALVRRRALMLALSAGSASSALSGDVAARALESVRFGSFLAHQSITADCVWQCSTHLPLGERARAEVNRRRAIRDRYGPQQVSSIGSWKILQCIKRGRHRNGSELQDFSSLYRRDPPSQGEHVLPEDNLHVHERGARAADTPRVLCDFEDLSERQQQRTLSPVGRKQKSPARTTPAHAIAAHLQKLRGSARSHPASCVQVTRYASESCHRVRNGTRMECTSLKS